MLEPSRYQTSARLERSSGTRLISVSKNISIFKTRFMSVSKTKVFSQLVSCLHVNKSIFKREFANKNVAVACMVGKWNFKVWHRKYCIIVLFVIFFLFFWHHSTQRRWSCRVSPFSLLSKKDPNGMHSLESNPGLPYSSQRTNHIEKLRPAS